MPNFLRVCAALLAALVPLVASAQALRAAPQLRPQTNPGVATQTGADYVVALVNSEPITSQEVRTRLLRAEQNLTRNGSALPPRSELARQVLNNLIDERAQLQLAQESGIKIDDSTVELAMQNVARQNSLSLTQMRQRLQAEGVTEAQFRADLRDQLMLQRLREREVDARVRVSDLEVDQFIREQQASTDATALELNLGHLLVAVPENASASEVAALQAKAQRAYERARAGEDFAALVRELSDAPERATGGALGLRPAERYPTLFVEAVARLPVGAVAAPVRSGAGFHVLKVLDKRQAGLPAANVLQTRARHILLRPGPQLTQGAAVQRLDDERKKLLAGQADFAQLARELSQDGSAREGGDLGWANPGQFVPEFEEAMNALSPGQISAPLVSRFGVHLIQVVERRQATLSEREQREIARNLVRERKLDEAFRTWVQEMRGRAFIELREPPQD